MLITLHITQPLTTQIQQLNKITQQITTNNLNNHTNINHQNKLNKTKHALNHIINQLTITKTNHQHLKNKQTFLLSTINHDLRTPLAALHATIKSLQNNITPNPNHYLTTINTQLDAMQQLINKLIIYTHIKTKKLEFEHNKINLTKLINETVKTITPITHQHELKLQTTNTKQIIALNKTPKLSRVLRNLIDNALHYNPIKSTMRVTLDTNPHTTRITITNKNPNFPNNSHNPNK